MHRPRTAFRAYCKADRVGSFAGLRFVVFFADILVYALGDPEWVEETADEWANGFQPAPNARLVKFMRADADADTMFEPEAWPLPHPRLIWQFCEVLANITEPLALGEGIEVMGISITSS